MTGPGNPDRPDPQSGQAYSQAIPLPSPPRGPVGPGPVPGTPPTPPPPSSSGRNVVVGLVLVASIVALVAAIVVAALLNNDSTARTATATSTPNTATAVFKVNDCLYDVPEAPKVGDCGNGGSPYQVTRVMPAGEQCGANQTSFTRGRAYCLAPNLKVNYCYTAPVSGTWIKPATQCGAPGTITVVSVVAGVRDASLCTGDYNKPYYFSDPIFTVCAWLHT